MNKKMKSLVAVTFGVALATVVAGFSLKDTDLSISSNSTGASKAYLKSYTANTEDATTGEGIEIIEVSEAEDGSSLVYGEEVTVDAKDVEGYELVSSQEQTITLNEGEENVVVFDKAKKEVISNVGFYLVMPWAKGTIIDEDGYRKFRETTGLTYKELGYTKGFSSELSGGDGTVTLDFDFNYNAKGNVTYSEESNIVNLVDVDLTDLEEGTVITTQLTDVNIIVVKENGETILQVTYNGDTYTTNVNDIKWYVIKRSTYSGWHVDGAANWTKLEEEEETTVQEETESQTEAIQPEPETETESQTETTQPEPETETESQTEVTQPETETESQTEATQPETETTQLETESFIETSSDEEEPFVEVAGDEDIVEIETILVTADDTYYGQVAADEDIVLADAAVSTSNVQTSDNSNILVNLVTLIGALLTVTVLCFKRKLSFK